MGVLLVAASGVVWLNGGIRTDILGFPIRATDPLRPLGVAAVLFAVRLIGLRWHGVSAEVTTMRTLLRPQVIATALTMLIVATSLQINYGVAGGSDAFGYVRQADGWLAGDLTLDQEWLRDAPWPHLPRIAAPLGYRPAAGGLSSVPVYPPGLPLLFAGAMWLLGQCGSVAVVALMAGLLVATTYRIGRRIGSPQIGAAAAWIVATSPVVIHMMASPMSDVPAAALSALAILGCLHASRTRALLAGLTMAVVVLIRPNLTPLVGVLGVWLLVVDRHIPTWRARAMRCALFFAAAAPGFLGIALFNQSVYGSPTASGYGDLDGFFSASYIPANIWNYSTWLLQSHTPLVALGLAAWAVPAGWLRKSHGLMQASVLGFVGTCTLAIYLPYQVFIDWWYLRFLLPAWPALAIGTAWLATNTTGRTYGRIGLLALILCGSWGLFYADGHDSFRVGWGELRYVSAAHAVRAITRPGSVILSSQHSGSVTYYGGRRSLRYDWIEPHRLNDVVQWLNARDHDVYVLLEGWEIEHFRARFRETPLGALPDESLVFHQKVSTHVFLYGTRPRASNQVHIIDTFMSSAVRCCEPFR